MFQIDYIDQYFIQEPENEDTLDSIFGWKKIANREVTSDLNITTGYQYPARMRYYFTNIHDPDITENLSIIHSNNIPISVVSRMNVLQEKNLAKALGQNESKGGSLGWCKEGIYVVDYFNLDQSVGQGHKHSIKYILESEKIYKSSRVLNMLIRSYVARKAEEKVQTSRYFRYPDIKIRIVSFIPKEAIIEHLTTRVRELDIVVNLGEIDPNLDYNDMKKKETMAIDLTPKHFTRYDVVNNEENDFPKFVYTVIGNTVTKIPVVKNTARKSGCYVSRHTNGVCVSNEYSELGEMEGVFGIYKTYLDAKFAGDPNKQLEFQKKDVEVRDIEFKKFKIRNDRFMALMDMDKKREDHIMSMEKMKLNMEVENARLLAEFRILMAKYTQEYNKAGKMDLSTYFTIALNCLKLLK